MAKGRETCIEQGEGLKLLLAAVVAVVAKLNEMRLIRVSYAVVVLKLGPSPLLVRLKARTR